MLAAGAYLLISAVTGKGKIYENPNVKKGKEEKYRKTLRAALFGLSFLSILQALSSILNWNKTLSIALWCALMLGFIALIVFTVRLTDRSVKPEEQLPKSKKHPAFDFDDEDKSE